MSPGFSNVLWCVITHFGMQHRRLISPLFLKAFYWLQMAWICLPPPPFLTQHAWTYNTKGACITLQATMLPEPSILSPPCPMLTWLFMLQFSHLPLKNVFRAFISVKEETYNPNDASSHLACVNLYNTLLHPDVLNKFPC